MAEGQLEAGGRQEAFAQMDGLGLRPISLAEKAAAGGRAQVSRLPAALASLSFRRRSTKISGARAGELHAAAFEPAGGGRAAEPRAGDSAQGSLLARRQRQVEGNPRPGGGRHVAGRCDGQVAGDLSARLCGDGAGGRDGRVSRCGAGPDRRLPGAREGAALEGDDRDALPDASCSCWRSAC